MVTVDTDELPSSLVAIATAAASVGWDVTATYADGPPPNIAVRFAHGHHRAWGAWALTTTAKGKPGVKWLRGCARHVPPGSFGTLANLKRYLGVA